MDQITICNVKEVANESTENYHPTLHLPSVYFWLFVFWLQLYYIKSLVSCRRQIFQQLNSKKPLIYLPGNKP